MNDDQRTSVDKITASTAVTVDIIFDYEAFVWSVLAAEEEPELKESDDE